MKIHEMKKDETGVELQIELTEEEDLALGVLAKKNGQTKEEAMNKIIQDLVENYDPSADEEEVKDPE